MFTVDQQEVKTAAADYLDDRGAGKIDPGANNGFAAIEFVLELGHGCYFPCLLSI